MKKSKDASIVKSRNYNNKIDKIMNMLQKSNSISKSTHNLEESSLNTSKSCTIKTRTTLCNKTSRHLISKRSSNS